MESSTSGADDDTRAQYAQQSSTETTSMSESSTDRGASSSDEDGQARNRQNEVFLYRVPFEINRETAALDTAIIVFNLALSYHIQFPSIWKAGAFYEVAKLLKAMRGARSDSIFDEVILNNLGVYYYENGRIDAASFFFQEAVRIARSNGSIPDGLMQSLLLNLRRSEDSSGEEDSDER
eukprot:scaffold591_cov176-Amphora_coffeaeformis.AAC.9